MPGGSAPRAAGGAGCEFAEGHVNKRGGGHIFPATRSGPLASNTADLRERHVPGRGLDRHRLASDNGRCRQKRLSSRGGGAARGGYAQKDSSARFAGRWICADVCLRATRCRQTENKVQNVPLLKRKPFRGAIQFFVSPAVCVEEVLVGRFGIPEVDGEVPESAGGIPQELSAPEMVIALEQPYPGAVRPVGVYKAFFTSWLDFELPEDYKHRCPIFCSR